MKSIKITLATIAIIASASSAFAANSPGGSGDREPIVAPSSRTATDSYTSGSDSYASDSYVSVPRIFSNENSQSDSSILERSRADADTHTDH